MSRESVLKKRWERPRLHSEPVHQTLAQPAGQAEPSRPDTSNPVLRSTHLPGPNLKE